MIALKHRKDTDKPVGNEDIYNNPEYMERLLESKKQIEEGKAKAIGDNALEFIDTLLTREEIIESDLRVKLIGELIEKLNENKK